MPDRRDEVLDAAAALEGVLDANAERNKAMRRRIREIRRLRQEGLSYREIVLSDRSGGSAKLVRLLSESAQALDVVGARMRRMEAKALHDEGVTMEQIAAAFGVTRQRVSALLSEARREASRDARQARRR